MAFGRRKSRNVVMKKFGKSRRLRSKKKMAKGVDMGRPAGMRKGRWHSRESLWKSHRKERRRRKMREASRRANRGS